LCFRSGAKTSVRFKQGGWPDPNLQTTLQGAPFKLRLGGDAQLSQNFSRLPTKLVPCLGDSNTFSRVPYFSGVLCARSGEFSIRSTRRLHLSPSAEFLTTGLRDAFPQ
jgi:hypothetical protein